jgi:hypothetical protein
MQLVTDKLRAYRTAQYEVFPPGFFSFRQSDLRSRSVVRKRPTHFICSEIRRRSGEIVVDVGNTNPCVHRCRAGAESEIKIRRVVKFAGIGWIRSGGVSKHVVVDQYAVFVLARSFTEGLKCIEFSLPAFSDVICEIPKWR